MTGAGWRDTWHWLARAALSRWWDTAVGDTSAICGRLRGVMGQIPGSVVLSLCESFLLSMEEPNGILLNSGDPGQENVKLEQ